MERSLSSEKMNNAAYNILQKEILKTQKKRSVERCNLENYEVNLERSNKDIYE